MSTENFAKPKIRMIPAKTRQQLNNPTLSNGVLPKLRVAAYARVSTDHEEQESSYEAQVEHFTKLICENEEWELAGIFADPGLSGKNVKRKEFQHMMAECDMGRIDKIITKSVSRFARNTLDCVQTARRLKEKGIGIYFEKENLDTLKESSEFVLTIMASLAEEESRSISNNIRWSVKKRFENGNVIINTARFLGYTKNEDGILRIVPDEAIIVRRIYAEFLDGYSLKEIATGLMKDKILSPGGKETWHATTIRSILQNEKYKGDSHLQKTYLPDFLSPRRIKNEGQADSYYVENDHAAIISKDTFEMVQQEFKNRTELRSISDSGHGKYSGKYAFSGMIICGKCGETYRRHQQYYRDKKYYTWACKKHENIGADNCAAKPIKEKAIEDAFLHALNGLIEDREEILRELKTAVTGEITDACTEQIAEIDERIQKEQELLVNLLKEKQEGRITQSEYDSRIRKPMFEIDELNLNRAQILTEQGKARLAEYRTEAVAELLKEGRILDEFDKTIFKNLVRRIKVVAEKEIEIEFECGIKVNQRVK